MSEPTREIELKARVDDLDAARGRIARAGARLVFEGMLRDRLYDTPDRSLSGRDLVLRLRSYAAAAGGIVAHLDWKGPTLRQNGFKVRSELTTGVTNPDELATILGKIGFEVVGHVDREVAQYELVAADESRTIVRFEQYPRMDILVEVEGSPGGIERAIEVLGIPRESFSAGRLADFVRAYEARTGQRGATCDRDLESASRG